MAIIILLLLNLSRFAITYVTDLSGSVSDQMEHDSKLDLDPHYNVCASEALVGRVIIEIDEIDFY